jgi:hypothetical protein
MGCGVERGAFSPHYVVRGRFTNFVLENAVQATPYVLLNPESQA